jgi:hypothetical protein
MMQGDHSGRGLHVEDLRPVRFRGLILLFQDLSMPVGRLRFCLRSRSERREEYSPALPDRERNRSMSACPSDRALLPWQATCG